MFSRILLGSALALTACSSKSEDPPSMLADTAAKGSDTASSASATTSGPPAGGSGAPNTPSGATSAPLNPQASAPQASAPQPSTLPPADSMDANAGAGPSDTASDTSDTSEPAADLTTTEAPSGSAPEPAASDEPAAGGMGGSTDDSPVASSAASGDGDAGSSPPAAGGDCSRETLSAFVDTYLDALAAHDASTLPVTDGVKYTENSHEFTLSEGLWAVGGEAELVRSLIDTVQCSTVTEVVLPEDGVDIVMTLRLTLDAGKLSEAEAVITRDGDWLFDADGYLRSADQKWDVLPEDQRTSREDLIAAAAAYYDEFNDNPSEMGDDPIDIPFDPTDCERLEGGAATAGCTMGIPDGVPITNRRYWADEEAGVSVAIALFASLLDVHFYRMIDGTIRNVHSMSVQSETFLTTGWPEGVD